MTTVTTETKPSYEPPSVVHKYGNPATAIPMGDGGVTPTAPPVQMYFQSNSASAGVRVSATHMQGVPVVLLPGATPYTQIVYMHTPKTSPFAVASLVLGIVSLFTLFLGIIFSILAIVFGIVAIHNINNQPHEYHGLCLAYSGISLGSLFIAFAAAIILSSLLY